MSDSREEQRAEARFLAQLNNPAARLAAERERFEAWAAKQPRAVPSDDGIGYLPSGFHEPSAWAGWLAALGLDP